VSDGQRIYLLESGSFPSGVVPFCGFIRGGAREALHDAVNEWVPGRNDLERVFSLVTPEARFWSHLPNVAHTELPITDIHWPIMSTRLLDTLRRAGRLSERLVSVVFDQHPLWSDSFEPSYRDVHERVALPLASNQDHVGLVVPRTQCLDIGRSRGIHYAVNPLTGEQLQKIRYVEEITFLTPPGGFPPIFQIAELPVGDLYVNETAKGIVESEGVRVRLTPFDVG